MFMTPHTSYGFPADHNIEDDEDGDNTEPRFTVVEYSSHYAVRDNQTDTEHPMGDGVDALTDGDGNSLPCGTEEFRQLWEDSLNSSAAETAEAYFPKEPETQSWFARLSASGYLDCTDWIGPFDTEIQAILALWEENGDSVDNVEDVCEYFPQFADFWLGYTQALAFTSHVDSEDGQGGSLFAGQGEFDDNWPECYDNDYGDKLTDSEREELLNDAVEFFVDNLADFVNDEVNDAKHAGRDFHFTRNGHGCGFWDGDWPTDVGQRLTESAKVYSSCELFGTRDADGELVSCYLSH